MSGRERHTLDHIGIGAPEIGAAELDRSFIEQFDERHHLRLISCRSRTIESP
jgi:hypothetical protein